MLTDLKAAVEEGEDFSAALAKYPKLFDKTYVSLVRASEATGTLGLMLERIATYLRKELDTRGKVRAAVAYPAVMLVVAIGVTIFLLTYVLPKFTPLFNRRGIQLPRSTVFMMGLSDVMTGVLAVLAGRQSLRWLPASSSASGTERGKANLGLVQDQCAARAERCSAR